MGLSLVGFVAVYKNCSKTQLMENLRNNAILGDKIEEKKIGMFQEFRTRVSRFVLIKERKFLYINTFG